MVTPRGVPPLPKGTPTRRRMRSTPSRPPWTTACSSPSRASQRACRTPDEITARSRGTRSTRGLRRGGCRAAWRARDPIPCKDIRGQRGGGLLPGPRGGEGCAGRPRARAPVLPCLLAFCRGVRGLREGGLRNRTASRPPAQAPVAGIRHKSAARRTRSKRHGAAPGCRGSAREKGVCGFWGVVGGEFFQQAGAASLRGGHRRRRG
jgi:hypothetical protein